MAKNPTHDQIFKAVVVIAIVFACVVETSGLPRPFPFRGRGGSRRFTHHRFGAEASGRQRSLQTPSPAFQESGQAASAHAQRTSRAQGQWFFENYVKTRMNSNFGTPGLPATKPKGVSRMILHPNKFGPRFTVNVIETINMSKLINTPADIPVQPPRETSKIHTFPADKGIPLNLFLLLGINDE